MKKLSGLEIGRIKKALQVKIYSKKNINILF